MPESHVTVEKSKGVCGPFPRSVWTHPYSPADDFDRRCAEIWKRTEQTKNTLWSFGGLCNHGQAARTGNGLERVVKPRDLDEVALLICREHQILLHEHSTGTTTTSTSTAPAPADICSHGDEMLAHAEEKRARVSAAEQEREEDKMSQEEERQCRSIERFLKGLLIHKKEAKEVPTLSEEDFPPLPCPSGDMKQVRGPSGADARSGTRRTGAPHWGPPNPAAQSKPRARATGLSSKVKDIPNEGCWKGTDGQQRSWSTRPVQPVQPVQPIQVANLKPPQTLESTQAAQANHPPWPKPPSNPHMNHCRPLQPPQCPLRRPPSQPAHQQHHRPQSPHPYPQHRHPHPHPHPHPHHHHPSFPSMQAGTGHPLFPYLPQPQVQAHPQQARTHTTQPTPQQSGPAQPMAQQRPCSYQPMAQNTPQPQQYQFPQQQHQYQQQIPLQDHQWLPQQQQHQLPPQAPQSCPPGGIQQHPMLGLHNPCVTVAMPSMHGAPHTVRAPPGFSHPQVVNVPISAQLATLGIPYGLLSSGCRAMPTVPPTMGAPRPSQHPSMAGDAPPWPSLALRRLQS